MKRLILAAPAALALAGCSSSPPQTFPPLDFSYLPPIVLRVSNINVVDNYVPSPGAANLIGQDPENPEIVLQNVLQHRLVASGAPGNGTVAIQTASIDQVGGNLVGVMTVDVSLTTPDGRATGATEASVTDSVPAPDPNSSQNTVQAALYGLTKTLVTDMNNQLQYQIQHNLGTWISYSATPGMPPPVGSGPGVIQASPLTAPGTPAPVPVPPTVPGTAVPSAPGNINPNVPNYLPGAGPAVLTPPPPPAQ
jgi:hypothetical protein